MMMMMMKYLYYLSAQMLQSVLELQNAGHCTNIERDISPKGLSYKEKNRHTLGNENTQANHPGEEPWHSFVSCMYFIFLIEERRNRKRIELRSWLWDGMGFELVTG